MYHVSLTEMWLQCQLVMLQFRTLAVGIIMTKGLLLSQVIRESQFYKSQDEGEILSHCHQNEKPSLTDPAPHLYKEISVSDRCEQRPQHL